ncbi:uncharacterized membrane protein YhaH (DUF805 family) [Pacificibacter maritimus]|uniref:Uncharacterized membrane protein YhaH (DUF805 family) n=1 Tax=Pacificibacter maritimus TaxID=762213 RepID=A0A3N4UXE2_9RHOB|nr:DUF805 domain-containing protein [Pacificibacter maritimus]RPE66280.1 uncharacterized membrane protein YhaH (DUF805 family) [Pacificibacter maritimus]
MDFQTAVKTCFQKYATFTGRARRSEFWWFVLAITIASVLISAISDFASIIFSLATIVPSIAVAARRLHDIDKSGWWQLIGFIPVVGWIIVIIWYAKEGSTVANRFGAPEKTVSEFITPE